MNLQRLRHFVVLANELSFRRAAAALNMAQPPLSVSIRKLEEELGLQLFDRVPRGVVMTDAGKAIIPHARAALEASEVVERVAREWIGGARGRIRVGFVGSATFALVPSIVPAFRARHPAVDLTLNELSSLDSIRAIEDGVLDVAFVRTPLLEAGRVALETIYQEKLVLMTPYDFPTPPGGQMALEDLRDEQFVFFDRHRVPSLWRLCAMACEAAGFLPRICEEAAQIHTIVALVESGLGVALVPAIMAQAGGNRVRYFPLAEAAQGIGIGLALATLPGEARAPVLAFCDCARESATGLSNGLVAPPSRP